MYRTVHAPAATVPWFLTVSDAFKALPRVTGVVGLPTTVTMRSGRVTWTRMIWALCRPPI
jgi:hypothetical protein